MKSFLRITVLNTFSLFLVAGFFPGLVITTLPLELFWAAAVFTLFNLIIKPIIKLFLLPINLLTLGLFRWIANVVILFILTRIIDLVKVVSFVAQPFNQAGFTIPSLTITYPFALIISSFLLSLVYNLLSWLLEE